MSVWEPSRESGRFEDAPERPYTITVIAVISICYGLFALCPNAMSLISPVMGIGMDALQAQIEKEESARRAEVEEDYADQIEDAETEEEKEELRGELDDWKASNPPFDPDFFAMYAWMGEPIVIGYFVSDAVLSALGNLLLIIGGIGLLLVRPWGRKISLFAGGYKLLFALVFAIWYGLLVPGQMESMDAMMAAQTRMAQARGGAAGAAAPIAMFSSLSWLGAIAGAVFMWIFASVYPLILVILLTRKPTREAFDEVVAWRAKAAADDDDGPMSSPPA